MMRFEYAGVTRDQARRMKRLFKADDENGDDAERLRAGLQYLNTKRGAALVRRLFPRGFSNPQDLEQLARLVVRALGDDALRPAPKEWQSWPDAKVTEKGFSMPNRADELETMVKSAGGFTQLCKRVAAGRNGDISERELMLMGTGYAMKKFPGLTPEQAFAKRYGDERMSGESRAFWDACGVIKGVRPARLEPTRGADADDLGEVLRQYAQLLREQRQRTRLAATGEDDEDEESDEDALDEITEKARKLRKSMPHLSEAQCFAKAYEDPANRELAKRERRQNGF
jgi:hypothetical protein